MKRNLAICLLLAIAVVAVYGQAVRFEFVNYDDPVYVTDNPVIARGLTVEGVAWVFTSEHGGNWHPLTGLSHMLDCELFGLDPAGHHAVNVMLHLANTLLLFGALTSMTRAPRRSAVVAALFALHPLHVESVAWISERKDVLSTLFFILAMWAYTTWARRGGARRYLLVIVLTALGLMAKPMLVTLPFVLLVLDWWPLGRMRLGEDARESAGGESAPPYRSPFALVIEKVPLFLLSAASCVMTVIYQTRGGAMVAEEFVTLPQRIANAVCSYIIYIEKMLWPAGLSASNPHPSMPGGTPWEWWQVTVSAVLIAVGTLLAVWARRRGYPLVGWLWYLGTLVPVIGLVQVGNDGIADRYTYIPLIGLFIVVSWGGARLAEKLRAGRFAKTVTVAAVLTALAAAAHVQAGRWESSVTLFEHAVAVRPESYLVHNNLGNALAERGDQDAALRHYAEAIRIHPGYVMGLNNMGTSMMERGMPDEAARYFAEALQRDPERVQVVFNLAQALQALGRSDEAIRTYREGLRLDPAHSEAHYNLGNLLEKTGQLDDAVRAYEEALRYDPGFALAHNNIGTILGRQGKLDEAYARFSQAVRVDPRCADAYCNLGQVHASRGERDEAARYFREALRIDPGHALARQGLAAVGGGM